MSTRPLGAADRDLEARLRALEMRLEAVQQSGEVVLSMLQRDLQTAAPAVVRAIDRVGLLVRRVLPQAAPGSSSLVWLANRDCGMARLPLGPVVKMASFLELWGNPLPCVGRRRCCTGGRPKKPGQLAVPLNVVPCSCQPGGP